MARITLVSTLTTNRVSTSTRIRTCYGGDFWTSLPFPPLSHFSSSPFGVCICSAGSHLQPCLQWSKHCKTIKHLAGLKYAPEEKPSFLHCHSCQDFQDKSALYCPSGQTEEWTGPRIIYRLFIPPCILVWNTAFVCSLTLSKCWGQNSGLNLLPPPPRPCPPEQVRWSRIVTGHCWRGSAPTPRCFTLNYFKTSTGYLKLLQQQP